MVFQQVVDQKVFNMVIISDVGKAQTFVAIIHKTTVDDKKLFNELVTQCRLAEVIGKPMYGIVEKGVALGVLKDMPWEKILHFTNKNEVSSILAFIDFEVSGGGLYT